MKLKFCCCNFLIAWLIAMAFGELSLNDSSAKVREQEQEWVLCRFNCQCPMVATYTSIMCDHVGLQSLPKSLRIPKSITMLSFKENQLRNITNDTFAAAPNLEELDLSANEISRIDNHSLQGFGGLITLHLSHNRLNNISSGVLKGLKKLEMLELGHNNLTELPANLFEWTPDLRELHLQSNHLVHLKEHSFDHLNWLEKLDLQDNKLSSLDPNLFRQTARLQWLTLSDNNFKTVPKKAFVHTKMLTSLDLSGNAFISLESGSFSTLYNLSNLYLNNLLFLQAIEKYAFTNMSNLKLLSCSYNSRLRFLHPEAFGSKYKNIIPSDKLYLGHNALRSIPEPAQLESWAKIGMVDLNENPWRCDCNLRWMARLKKEITGSIRCETPLVHHGRTIDTMTEEDFVCNDSWAFPNIFIMACAMAVLCLSCLFGSAVLCYKTPYGQMVRARWQFSYAKVNKKHDVVDLEWDPSADI